MNKYKEMMEQVTPSYALVQATKNKMKKEQPIMIKNYFRTVAVAAALLLLTTGTVFAAWRLLSPNEVAEQMGHYALSAALESEDAIIIDESQTAGEFTFTLMAIVSGDNLTNISRGFAARYGRSYAVLAVRRTDGSPMAFDPLSLGQFSIGPLIGGVNPLDFFMPRTGSGIIIDGVMYFIVGSDDISVFADRGVYIHVTTSFAGSFAAIVFDETTGVFAPNPEYGGISLLFELPLDISLADPVRAQEFLDALYDGRVYDFESSDTGERVIEHSVTHIVEDDGENSFETGITVEVHAD